jgi:hypothetical protein
LQAATANANAVAQQAVAAPPAAPDAAAQAQLAAANREGFAAADEADKALREMQAALGAAQQQAVAQPAAAPAAAAEAPVNPDLDGADELDAEAVLAAPQAQEAVAN